MPFGKKIIYIVGAAVYISKENHQTIGKLDILCVFLGFGLDLEEKCSILKLLHVGFIQTKEVGAERGEKDKCYVQTCSYCLKPKFQTIYYISAYCGVKIRHSLCIPWVWAGFGGKGSILKLLHVGFILKKMVPNRMKRTNAMFKHVFTA